MSLVVAETVGSSLHLVSDTKVTFTGDDTRTRRTFENVLPKLVILRDDLCVGVAGNDPVGSIESLVSARTRPLRDLVELTTAMPHASFIIASSGPPAKLIQTVNGESTDQTELGRAWIGDSDGYEIFQRAYHSWPMGVDADIRLMSSLQHLLSFPQVNTIGGLLCRVVSSSAGFRFLRERSVVGPEILIGSVEVGDGALRAHLVPPPFGDRTSLSVDLLPGTGSTPGAIGYFIGEASLGLLFPQSSPTVAVSIKATTKDGFAELSNLEHDQHLRLG